MAVKATKDSRLNSRLRQKSAKTFHFDMLLFLRISVLLLSVMIRDVKGGGGGGQGDHNMGKKRACMHAGRENKACRSTSEREENKTSRVPTKKKSLNYFLAS